MLSQKQILNYLKTYKQNSNNVKKIGIFGSFAKNKAKEQSDIDIVVDMEKPNLIALSSIMIDISEHFNKKVDIVALWDKMNPRLKNRIEKEAIYV